MPKQLFISYSHADDQLLERLHKHLAQLQREGTVAGWYDRDIHAGGHLDKEIDRELARSQIFIACASPDYIASRYCYERELAAALEREDKGDLAVVPIIFEPCDWLATPLQKFKALPKDGKAISEYTNQNVAFLEVVTELRRLATSVDQAADAQEATAPPVTPAQNRYRVKREFDALAKRDFVESAFSEMHKFFEASVAELSAVPDLEATLSPLTSDHFSCTVINRGISRGFETVHVRRGGSWGAIDVLYGESNSRSTSNGGFGVEADEYQLYLTPTLFRFGDREDRVSPRQAAQMIWDDLLSKVGVGYV
jgi:hypothetical protein